METIEATLREMSAGQQGATVTAPLQARLQTSLGSLYRLEREMTGAGMSHVFLAEEPALGRKVVLKVVGGLPETGAKRLEEEIRLSASLQQANIIPVLSAGIAGGLPYYTMPLVEDRSVRERLKRDGRLPIREAVGILRDVARALAYAHAHGVVHRDIKPGNVLLSGGSAVLTDFGIARALHAALEREDFAEITSVGLGSGTPDYMAPEQVIADAHADHRVDIYAFGCLAFTLLTGSPPFAHLRPHEVLAAHLNTVPLNLSEVRSDVPPRISTLIARCLEKDPAKRPQSANEVLQELDREDVTSGFRSRSKWMFMVAAWFAALVLAAMTGS